MRAVVLRDKAFVKSAGRFVRLEIDTEKPGNAPFLERFAIEVWPTFLVVDPATEKAVLKWLGTATAPDLERLLSDGERALKEVEGDSPAALLARADRANGAGEASRAIELWRRALEKGGPGWRRRDRVLESLAMALQGSDQPRACAELAAREAPDMHRTQSFANVVSVGLACAEAADEEPWVTGALAALEPLAAEAVKLPGVLADDRAGLYEELVEARRIARDEVGARRLAEEWWAFLVAERERARNADARLMLDPWIVDVARSLGDPSRAVPFLRASQREAPRDYNPPFRLAALYLDAGKYEEALEASNRAVQLAYGPRKLRVMSQRAAILESRGDRAGARRAVEDAIGYAATLPQAQQDPGLVEQLEAKLAKLEEP
jgi:tetratricopeptide (TPR) repeat protein